MTAVLLCCGLTHPARAQLLPSYTATSGGTTGAGGNTTLPVPGTYYYGDSFSAGTGGTMISGSLPSGFYDDYIFTVSGTTADSVTSSITLNGVTGLQGISGLEVRLYTYNGESLPLSGSLPPGDVMLDSWSSSFSSGPVTVTEAVIGPTSPPLSAGTYVLEVRGTVDAAGGSYSGTLNLQPVPLPATLSLLLTGLVGGLGFLRHRQRGGDEGNSQNQRRAAASF